MELYGSFEGKRYKVEAYIPSSSSEPMQFHLKALKDGKLVNEMKIPLNHEPIFCVDTEDRQNLEAKTEELMKSLP